MSETPLPPDETMLQAYVDDRLGAEARARVEQYLADHPEAAQRLAHYRAQNEALHRLYDAVLDQPHALVVPPPRARWDSPWAIAATLALGVALGYVAHGALMVAPDRSAPSIARQAALAYAAYVPEVRHPVEVAGSEEAHLVAWLSKRLDAPLKAPALGAAGYRLLGGRLLPATTELGDAPVALLIYENGAGARLSLMIRRAQDSRETAFQFAREGATGVFYWIDGPFGYALAGDVDREALGHIAQLVYRQLNP